MGVVRALAEAVKSGSRLRSQLLKGEGASQLADEVVFGRFHLPAVQGVMIVVAKKVEQAMNAIADKLALPRRAELASLADGLLKTHEDFAVQ